MQIGMAVWCFCVLCGSTTLCVCVLVVAFGSHQGLWLVMSHTNQPPHGGVVRWSHSTTVPLSMSPLLCVCVGRDKSGDGDHGGAITLHCHQQHKDHLHVVHLATHSLVCLLLGFLAAHGIQQGVCGMVCGMATIGTSTPHLAHTHTSETVIGGTPNWWLC